MESEAVKGLLELGSESEMVEIEELELESKVFCADSTALLLTLWNKLSEFFISRVPDYHQQLVHFYYA